MRRIFLSLLSLSLMIFALTATAQVKTTAPTESANSAEKTAQEAFIYGYPMVQVYGIIYSYSVDVYGDQYKGPFNTIVNVPKVFTPNDKAIVTPNSDTPYSFLSLDLRAEPIVITVPEIEKSRYYSVMFLDLYTYVYGVVGSRATGNDSGKFLVVGPNWKGETPKGIKKVLHCDTDFSFVVFRTQLFSGSDIDNVIKIQDQYAVEPLSNYLKKAAPEASPKIDFLDYSEELSKGPEFFTYLNYIFQFCPTVSSEKKIRADFDAIGFNGKGMFSPKPENYDSIENGLILGQELLTKTIEEDLKKGVSSGEFFGSREFLGTNYMNRAIGAKLGIGGLIKEEAIYFPYKVNSEGQTYNTAENNYSVTFKKDELPPVNAFWSFTMYDATTQLLIDNSIDRYLINSTMMSNLKFNTDGSLTIYIQKDSPGKDKESNWLPAPNGDAYVVLRCYWPKESLLKGEWKAPVLVKIN